MTDGKLLGRRCADGTLWQSRHVGDWLAIRSDSMRALIAKNVAEFRSYGDLQPGRRRGEYLLNFAQVLLVCLLAKTKPAEEIRMEFAFFERAFNGGLDTAPPDQLQALELQAQERLIKFCTKLGLRRLSFREGTGCGTCGPRRGTWGWFTFAPR